MGFWNLLDVFVGIPAVHFSRVRCQTVKQFKRCHQTRISSGGTIQQKLTGLHRTGRSQWERPEPARTLGVLCCASLKDVKISKDEEARKSCTAGYASALSLLLSLIFSPSITCPPVGLASARHHVSLYHSHDPTRNSLHSLSRES